MAAYGAGPYGAGLYGIGQAGAPPTIATYGTGRYGLSVYGAGTPTVAIYGQARYGANVYGSGTPTIVLITPGSIYTSAGATVVTFTGSYTTWLSVAPTFTVSAGSLGAVTATTNTSATATYTPPGTAQNVTFTDVTDGNSTVILAVINVPVIPPQVAGGPPSLLVEVSFTTKPTDPPVWVNISAYVERCTITRGRNRELDRSEGGHCTLDIDNGARTFDSTYAAGPYYPNILPVRRIRVQATYNGATFPLFSGYIESWGQRWRGWQDSVVTITAADAFKPLNLAQLNTTFPSQLSGARVSAVLDAINWTIGGPAWVLGVSTLGTSTVLGPVGDRNVATGLTTIQPSTLSDTSALSHLQDIADTEQGLLLADRTGVVTFYGRDYPFQPPQLVSRGIFGELEMPYVDIELAYDDSQLWNDVRVTRQGGTQQSAADVPSQQSYYLRTLSRSTLHATDSDALTAAQSLVARYAQPKMQIISMSLDGAANPAVIYPQMLDREINDRVTVRRRPASGPMIEQVSLIQGIFIDYDPRGGEWSAIWRLSTVATSTFWILGDSTYGLLGTSTRLFT